MKRFKPGDRVCSRRHKSGEIHIDVAGHKVLLGRLVKKNGQPGRKEVVVAIDDVTHRWPKLPGVK